MNWIYSILSIMSAHETLVVIIVLLALVWLLFVFFLPSLIALVRDVPNLPLLWFTNLLIGWTGVGWICVFLWAILEKPALPTVTGIPMEDEEIWVGMPTD